MDKVVLDVYPDKEGLASEVAGLSKGGESMPRPREGGVVNVKTQR